jgi:prepilin-type N-terminal cleavage/methylation domain-containing protein
LDCAGDRAAFTAAEEIGDCWKNKPSSLRLCVFAPLRFKKTFSLRRRPSASAFTLIELMVVILLIAILTAAIIPEMRGTYEGEALRATSRQLVDVMNLASSRAISLNEPDRFRLNPATGKFLVERPAPKAERARGFVPLKDVSGANGALDKRIAVEIRDPIDETPSSKQESEPATAPKTPSSRAGDVGAESDDTIAFYPDGTADAKEIVLRDRDGFRLALRVNPITSRVRVVELERMGIKNHEE